MPEQDTKNISVKEKNSSSEPAKKKTFFQRFQRSKNLESNTKKDLHVNEHNAETKLPETGQSLGKTKESPDNTSSKSRIRERFFRALSNTGRSFNNLFLDERKIDSELLEDLEERLLLADVGVETTLEIIEELTDQLKHAKLADGNALFAALQDILIKKLKPCQKVLEVCPQKSPFVILVIGVNGVGKTTTVGKIAKYFSRQNKSVMLAAGDTFRAAAVEQLQEWGKINEVPVIAQGENADSASVIYDAMESSKSDGINVLIADTAGRLHTKNHLMEELKKVRRVIARHDDSAPHEILLVVDAGTGQNAINQMKEFNDAVTVTGLVITKLDGTAKGGIIFSLFKRFGVPVRFVGLGENLDDLQPFNAEDYVHALLNNDNQST